MLLFITKMLCVLLLLSSTVCCLSADSIQTTQLVGAGASGLAVYSNAQFAYRFVDPNVQTSFNGVLLSDAVLCRVLNFTKECAATDTAQPQYLDWGSLASIPSPSVYQRYPDLQLYPTGAYAVAFLFNLNGVTNLVLNMQILVKIWSGRITTWDHPDIVASNPNFTAWNVPANQSIQLLARGETTGSTVMMKKTLRTADPTFSTAANWAGLVKPIVYSSSLGLVSYIMRTPYTFGFAPAGDAAGIVPLAKLNRSGVVVECNTASVQYAVLEKGLSFGNNGDDPARLTGDINSALNPLAWPFAMWTYAAVRKSTLRPGATCATVTAMVNYWLWFWHSSEVAAICAKFSFVALPEVVRDQVVARFKKDIYCNGQLVWQEADVPVLTGYGPESATPVFDKFQQAYALVNDSVALNYTTLDGVDVSSALQSGGFVVSTSPPSSSPSVYSLVLGSEAVVAISTIPGLVLDGLTLARILNGDITTWLHPDLAALNPGGLRVNGQPLNNTAQRIVLLQGPAATSAPLTALLRRYYPPYTGAALQAAERFPREALLWSGVIGTPFAFSVTPLVGTLPVEVLPAAIVAGGGPVAPSLASARACTAAATFDPATKAVTLPPSGNSSCYPLLLTLYVSLQRQCPAPPSTAQAVTFLQWMFTKDTLSAALDALNLVSLYGVSDAIQAANDDALFQLSCHTHPVPSTPTDMVPLLLGIIIPIAVVVLAGLAACGWWLWRVTEYNRMMRKKFSNDNVAESCAEAIARFDLQAVAWLREVKEPNKIQLAFLAIITLLTEVKPYIPDQLLSRLTAGNAEASCDGEEGDNDSDHRGEKVAPDRCPSTETTPRQLSLSYTGRSPSHSNSRSPRHNRRATQATSLSDGPRPAGAMRDWRRRRCTYMCVRFGSAHPAADRRLPELVRVAGEIVDIAKAHGATIDALGVDFVNVHWGVTSTSASSAIRAVQAGLEVTQLRATLPEDQRGAFWLQMGIGRGPCDCGTVSSASGHRFFVVWGPEAALAMHIATTSLPKRVLGSLLVSPAVQQEVQYTVQCMPRLWLDEDLLWEPLCVLKKKEDDEWMYELQNMDNTAVLPPKAMLEAFVAAKGEAKHLSACIAELRSLHGGKLSAQDQASLDLLLVTTPNGVTLDRVTPNT